MEDPIESVSEPSQSKFPNLITAHQALIHYMANLGRQNAANPHAIPGEVGLTGLELIPYSVAETVSPTPVSFELTSPDPLSLVGRNEDGTIKAEYSGIHRELETVSTFQGTITLGQWLVNKLSPTAWLYDSSSKAIPRYILAILLENDDEKVAIANAAICRLEPYSMKTRPILRDPSILPFGQLRESLGLTAGQFETEFDDFTITDWTRIYYLAKDNPRIRLSEEAKAYILDQLLKFGGKEYESAIPNTGSYAFISAARAAGYPVTAQGIQNSENHLLMVNGSAYLKNQLIDKEINPGSELERGLCEHLGNIYQYGLTEFNAIPYAGYTIDALLNLHDFADEPVRSLATKVLDKIAYEYVIHSTNDGKHFRPFARHIKKVKEQNFILGDAVRPFMMAWLGKDLSLYRQKNTSRYSSFALTAISSGYRPPEYVYRLAGDVESGYLALTAQPHGNAEVSYKNSYEMVAESGERVKKQYLLSGGGLNDEQGIGQTVRNVAASSLFNFAGQRSVRDAEIRLQRHAGEVISHNPCLILAGEEGSFTLRDSFFLGTDRALTAGPGIESRGKNNSGIYFDTLIGDYHVYIPEKYREQAITPDITSPWRLYEISEGLSIAVFDGEVSYQEKKGIFSNTRLMKLGIIMVLPNPSITSQELINQIARENLPTHLAGLESYPFSKLTQENFQELKKLFQKNEKINSIAHDSNDYKMISFTKQETQDLIESLKKHSTGKEMIKLLVFGKALKFPEGCQSVMKGKRIYFNQESALDRWVIGGTDDCHFTSRDRKFYAIEGSEEDAAPGWQGSATQHFPGGPILNDLGEEPAHYHFLSATKSPPVEESEAIGPRRGAGAGSA